MNINVKCHPFGKLRMILSLLKDQMSNVKCQRGFTLIELLVVVVILVVLGSIIAGVITFSLRGTNKANTIENIRQSGNYAISQMGKTIEYAKDFDGLSVDGNTYVKTCPNVNPTPIPTFSAYNYVKITSFDGDSIIYSCSSIAGIPTVAYQKKPSHIQVPPPAVSFIDTSSIQVSSCSFTCVVARTTDVPVIQIDFTLQPAVASNLVEKFAQPINFETSVTMRNYQR